MSRLYAAATSAMEFPLRRVGACDLCGIAAGLLANAGDKIACAAKAAKPLRISVTPADSQPACFHGISLRAPADSAT
jgi:hypothetical protein